MKLSLEIESPRPFEAWSPSHLRNGAAAGCSEAQLNGV